MSNRISRATFLTTGALVVVAASAAVCAPAIASTLAVDSATGGALPLQCTLNADGMPQLDTPGCAVKANPSTGRFVAVETPGTITKITNVSDKSGTDASITVSDGSAMAPVTLAPGQSKTLHLAVDQNTVLTVTGVTPGQSGYLYFDLAG